MRLLLLVTGLLLSAAVSAQGQALHDAACLQCHASLSNGNPYQLYQRQDRKVKTLDGLRKRVKNCAVAADVSWTNEQREAVVTYLRENFYQF
jgi:mono/diheme cytochrome c family protein